MAQSLEDFLAELLKDQPITYFEDDGSRTSMSKEDYENRLDQDRIKREQETAAFVQNPPPPPPPPPTPVAGEEPRPYRYSNPVDGSVSYLTYDELQAKIAEEQRAGSVPRAGSTATHLGTISGLSPIIDSSSTVPYLNEDDSYESTTFQPQARLRGALEGPALINMPARRPTLNARTVYIGAGEPAQMPTEGLGSNFNLSEYINPETGRFYVNEFQRNAVFNPESREAERMAMLSTPQIIPRNMAEGGLASVANQLASEGRGGDSMLVHMSPDEVAGLQALAQQYGTSLTINPETGLPEAIKLKKLFKVLAPIALGAFLGPGAFGIQGLGMSAGAAGLTVGGLTAITSGSLEKGISAGLGAYGGAGLAEGAAAASAAGEQEALRQASLSQGPSTGAISSGSGGISAGTVPIGADVATSFTADPTLATQFTGTGTTGFQATLPEINAGYGSLTSPNALGADYASAATGLSGGTAIPAGPTPMEAFTDKVGMGTAGSLYAGSVAMPAAIEEQEKFKQQEALILAQEDEERRKYRELFESTLGAVPTRMVRSGGLMSLADGGMTYMEAGGTTGPTGLPRDVTGTGDGMSDSVPATIEGVQEARLADGEFVIPADVVADIGNGSSDAGSKKLYDMMDRIRKARHGTTEQPPEINAEKLMPA
jgi:hypothetical protein